MRPLPKRLLREVGCSQERKHHIANKWLNYGERLFKILAPLEPVPTGDLMETRDRLRGDRNEVPMMLELFIVWRNDCIYTAKHQQEEAEAAMAAEGWRPVMSGLAPEVVGHISRKKTYRVKMLNPDCIYEVKLINTMPMERYLDSRSGEVIPTPKELEENLTD